MKGSHLDRFLTALRSGPTDGGAALRRWMTETGSETEDNVTAASRISVSVHQNRHKIMVGETPLEDVIYEMEDDVGKQHGSSGSIDEADAQATFRFLVLLTTVLDEQTQPAASPTSPK